MSRGDSTLAMLLKIQGDPSSAVASLDSVTNAVKPLQAEIDKATAAALIPFKAEIESLQEQLGTLQGQLTATTAELQMLQERGMRPAASETRQAKEAMMGISEEIGVKMPRFIRSFLVELGGVGPALSAAFSTVAVVGIVEMLVEKLPAAWDKLSEHITGWGKKAQEEYDKLLESNRKLEDGLLHFQMRLSEAVGGGAAENLELVEKKMVQVRKSIVDIQKQIEEGKHAVLIPGMGSIDTSIAGIETLNKQMAGLKKTESELAEMYTKLSQDAAIERIKDEEETRKWFGKKIEEADKYRENEAKKAAKAAEEAHKKLEEQDRAYALKEAQYIRQGAQAYEERLREVVRAVQKEADEEEKIKETMRKGDEALEKHYTVEFKKDLDERLKAIEETGKLAIRSEEQRLKTMERDRKHDYHEQIKEIKSLGQDTEAVLGAMSAAFQKHHAVQVALIVARAAIRVVEEIAEALSSAAFGDFRGAALHYASAAQFGIVGAIQAGSSAAGGGGPSAAGGGGHVAAAGAGAAPAGSVALAPGSAAASTPLHVVIMGSGEQAQYLANILNGGVRTGSVQLAASHAPNGTLLGG